MSGPFCRQVLPCIVSHEAGGASYGPNIVLPHEQSANPYVEPPTALARGDLP